MYGSKINLLLLFILLSQVVRSAPQATIHLVVDQGVKQTESVRFFFSGVYSNVNTHDFTYDKFSKDGVYLTRTQWSYSEEIQQALYTINVILKTKTEQAITDSLLIDETTERVEIFVFIATADSIGDFIREIKTLHYQTNADYLTFSFIDKPQAGSKAIFNILNAGNRDLYGYPNNAFFFGTLYKESYPDSWSQYYPIYSDIVFCDTTAPQAPLLKGATAKAITPDDKNCTPFVFKAKGNYFFELLYIANPPRQYKQGLTTINKIDLYRQILEFTI